MAIAPPPPTLPLPFRVEDDGTVRVGECRVTLDLVIGEHKDNVPPEEMVRKYPTLKLADVYAAIAYYLSAQEQVEAYLAARETKAKLLREKIESEPGYQEWRADLAARVQAARQK